MPRETNDVVVKRLAWRIHRPWRVYYRDGIGRLIHSGGGFDTQSAAYRHADVLRSALESRAAGQKQVDK